MDYGRLAQLTLRVQHRHSDGSWSQLEPVPSHHDPAAHDPERDWGNGAIYRCMSCEEEVSVETIDDPGDPRS
jgi:hypothetical protein